MSRVFALLPLALALSAGLAIALLASYLLGAVPFGFLMAKGLKGIDIRTIGSGNIGATNAMRAMGKPLGLLAFFLDCAKGFVAAYWLAGFAGPEGGLTVQVLCGALAVVGHCFPIYLGFKGGKGVATACGTLVAIDPMVFLIGGAVWLVLAFTARYVSLASIGMGIAFPIAAFVRLGQPGIPLVLGLVALMALILIRHRSNIVRLRNGTEPKIGANKKEGASKS